MLDAGAVISPCGKFRYRLWRQWATGPLLVFVMLNPSTADAGQDDPTIRKCIGFAKRLGFAGIEVVNLFAYRATNPRDLYNAGPILASAVGPQNDATIRDVAKPGAAVICAWGAHARRLNRAADVGADLRLSFARLYTLGLTADGIPRHPLMLPYASTPAPYLP